MANQYLSVNQAAINLGVKPATIRKWLKLGKIKGEKFGGFWVIPPEELTKAAAIVSPLAPPPAVTPPPIGHEELAGIRQALEGSIKGLEALKTLPGMSGKQAVLKGLEHALLTSMEVYKACLMEL